MTAARAVEVPTDDDLRRAASVVARHLRPTPLVELSVPGAGQVLAKLETVQPTGSFKVRGALVALTGYAGRAVVTASAGNHGLAVAFAAARLGMAATIVVPRTASTAKIEALRRLGADLVLHGDGYEEAERHGLGLAMEGVYVSAYNDRYVIAGAATCTAEVLDAGLGECTLIVPVGGGGLISGAVLRAAGRPDARVVGVEAAASCPVSTSVAAGREVVVRVDETLADGLAGNFEPGSVTLGVAASGTHTFATVTEAEIAAAIRFLALDCGLVVEGAGAVGVAALMSGKVPVAGTPVVLLTGRNIAARTLGGILS
ncbi:MAG TPA: pyridoxal-phosphate dependent enzyme [Actinophytocola sp.]|uniref:threonine ammonia-lyase n=1 Tax=Actinophytocola sp. TaxID=1872138 RepID=UPI002DDCB8AA|nr:pyridoxal-phosphate dependent enzyme [Actinophytocola sp.]HEV2778638.1 pyridoxal-phosphate dependent enzyme [Actinophytocola sp.]